MNINHAELPINIKLPNDFLNEEIRCEYKVDSKMKAVWAVELDLYTELKRVCDKYSLTVIADSGTVLGAVRHSGFIPWDDDLDFSMSRKDFDKLCKVAESEFQSPYFWQTEDTDPKSCRGHAQLRNSNTTAILKDEQDRNITYNQGIFIDIFPIDNVPDNKRERDRFIHKLHVLHRKSISYRDMTNGINASTGMKRILKTLLLNTVYKNNKYNNRFYKKLEQTKKKYEDYNTEHCAYLLFLPAVNNDERVCPKKWFENRIELPFEFIKVSVPVDYKDYLKKGYGEWEKYVVSGSRHGSTFFDPYKSYLEYKNYDFTQGE